MRWLSRSEGRSPERRVSQRRRREHPDAIVFAHGLESLARRAAETQPLDQVIAQPPDAAAEAKRRWDAISGAQLEEVGAAYANEYRSLFGGKAESFGLPICLIGSLHIHARNVGHGLEAKRKLSGNQSAIIDAIRSLRPMSVKLGNLRRKPPASDGQTHPLLVALGALGQVHRDQLVDCRPDRTFGQTFRRWHGVRNTGRFR